MRSSDKPFGGSISTLIANSFFCSFLKSLLSGSRSAIAGWFRRRFDSDMLAACFYRRQRFHGFGHRANVRGRGAAAAAENANTERGRFASELRKIFRRGFRVNDAVAFALGESRVGHAADANVIDAGKLAKNRKQRLRTQRAVRADDLHVFRFELRGRIGRAQIAVRSSLFGVRELRDDRQTRERTNRVDRELSSSM